MGAFSNRLGTIIAWLPVAATIAAARAATQAPTLPPLGAATNGPAASAEIRPIKEAIPFPDYWLWLWIALGLLLTAAVAWWLFRKWSRREDRAPHAVLIPPHRRALDRLKAAATRIEEPEPFCMEVSGILRAYLEERFNLRAPERTTEEFLAELQQASILDAAQKDRLAAFLTSCDLVKFARHEPERQELERLLDTAIRLVEETTRTIVEQPQGQPS